MKSINKKLLASISVFMILGISLASAVYYQPNLFSDHPFLKKLISQLADYQEETKEDKVYLHFDKKFYEPGEDVWFNAYVRDAQTFQASIKSGVVYVELINPQSSVEQQLTLIAQTGKAAGMFNLPKELKGGLYKIKAYTKWQKNSNAFFEREITVQKSVLPNLNMALNFNRKAYGAGAFVDATLDLNTLTKQPLANHSFDYVVSLEGETVKRGSNKTDVTGRSILKFKLPQNLKTNDGLLNVLLKYKGQTESISRSIPIVLGNIDLAFYPEGGELVEGMTCGIGFKALNEFGKPADVKGNIVDQNNKIVASFDSYHQGMGQFDFVPKEGDQYMAQIISPANIKATYPLPVALKRGYALKIKEQTTTSLEIEVLSSENEELYVVAQSRQKVYFSKDIQAQSGTNTLSIPVGEFPIGITQLTLFDHKKIARAERLVFINKDKQLNIKVTTDKEKYLPREKVNMTVEVTDERGIPMPGSFSLAVVDDKLLNFADDKQGHLLSYMLLESDLTGELVEPNFYFDREDDATRLKPEINRMEALDHLLMTQGWRKFKWEEVTEKSYAKPTTSGELAKIGGTVLDGQGNPIEGVEVAMLGKNKKIITDKKGKFSIDDWALYEPVNLQLTADNHYPVSTFVNEYNSAIALKLYKKRIITGIVKNKENRPIANIQIVANGVPAVVTDGKGKFSITIPENVKSLQAYGDNYRSLVVLEDDIDDVNIVLSYIPPPPIFRNEAVFLDRAEKAIPGNPNRVRALAKGNIVVHDEEKVLEDESMDQEIEEEIMPVEELEEELEEIADDEDFGIEEDKDIDVLINNEKAKKEVAFGKDIRKPASTRYNRVREFPVVQYDKAKVPATRTDFRSTIYWNPAVEVGKNGKAELSFYNNDAITQFRVTVEGFSVDGGIGRMEQKYFTQLPVELLTKVPREVLTGDKINIPLTFTNNTDQVVDGKLMVNTPSHIKLLENVPTIVKLKAQSSKTIYVKCEVLNKIAEGDFSISLQANGLKDQLVTTIDARPRGFPVHEVFTGDQMSQDFMITIQEALKGSLVAKLQAYPNTLDEVMKGMESMLRMPGGCFEQTSSSNYPNLLVLDYLRETGTSLPAIEDQAKGYLDVGYKRLVGYESKGGGFDWWGRDPAHEALSAYGLMEFVDMKSVYPVDEKLIERTAKWLLSRRDGKGGWTKNQHALHSWAVAEVTDAYIVWAVTAAGYSKDITKEINKSYKDAVSSEDPYMMALMANALFNAGDNRATLLVKELVKFQKKDGSFTGLTSSVTNSTGQSLMIETSSLAALAMMQIKGYTKEIEKAIKAVQKGKNYYGYGSTQGTVLALKAMLEYAKKSKRAAESGMITIWVNNKEVLELSYDAEQKEITLPNIGDFLTDGKQKVRVTYTQTKTAMPFDLELSYTTRLPQNSTACKLKLTTELPSKSVKMGETVRMTTILENTINKGQPMTMAMVGIPAGLSLQPWQLKELQDKKIVDYYELFDGYVVFHYEQLKPNESKIVKLDLKADVPGVYEAPASSAFLYYTNEHKVWSMPEQMTIN